MPGLENRVESSKKTAPSGTIDIVDLWKDDDRRITQRSSGAGSEQRLSIGNQEYQNGQPTDTVKSSTIKPIPKYELPKIGIEFKKIP